MPVLAACGSMVAQSCQREYGLLLGSGTAALALACRMVPPGRKKVIVPAIACANVLYAVRYSECMPVFVDICPESGVLDPESVRVALQRDPAIGAVIVAHTYGHVADLRRVAGHARATGALVIEDAAQAQGGVYADGSPLGALGDLSLVSFGHTKILNVGGGGVLMTDRRDMYEDCLALTADLPLRPVDLAARFAQYRSSYYCAWSARVNDPAALLNIDMLHLHFRETFLHRADDATARQIIAGLPMLSALAAARVELAAEYATLLSGVDAIRLCTVAPGSVPWRFVFRAPAHERDLLVDRLRDSSLDVSCWYPSLAHFCATASTHSALPNADAFEQEVVNLWVTPGYDRQHIQTACALIRDYFD